MQRSGSNMEGQQLKAGWLGFFTAIAAGISGFLVARLVSAVHCTGAFSSKSFDAV